MFPSTIQIFKRGHAEKGRKQESNKVTEKLLEMFHAEREVDGFFMVVNPKVGQRHPEQRF
jgi:hypothetical protein